MNVRPNAGVLARCLFGLAIVGTGSECPGQTPPVVAGLARAGFTARVRGLVLLGELGCTGCHARGAAPVDQRVGPDLAIDVDLVQAGYLERFLADPLATAPGTTMPDLLRGRQPAARREAAEALAHYLQRTFSKVISPVPRDPPPLGTEPPDPDREARQRGRELFHECGCVACHAPRGEDGAELDLPGSVHLAQLPGKYSFDALRTFLLDPGAARPALRMPDPHLSPSEAFDLASYLLGPGRPGTKPFVPDADKVATGRALYAAAGCVHCHALPDDERAPSAAAAPLQQLDPSRGCLSGTVGAWPFYALSSEQRADIAAALVALGEPLDDGARIGQLLAERNCLACHERGGHGGIEAARQSYFVGNDAALGQDGRVPPSLTGVGTKLQPAWLVDAIAHGQSVRPYLRTRMPGFGVAFASALAELLERSDTLPALAMRPLPEDDKAARAVLELGRELVGDKGMNCISCHVFAGERAGAIGAVDLVDSTGQRLRASWFAHYLRAPFEFKPGTLMPQFFPGGVSTRPELGGGDAARQIEAMWYYLAEGRNVNRPSGMRPSPIELEVGDEAVMLRRSVQNTGKRGISVGYPGGVNLTFDAERLGLNQIWWGRFVDASPVWTGQGSGEARVLGRQRVALPNGPAFAVLADAGAAWPTATRRELGQRWLGYDLDAQQRPSFRYVCAGVEVTDTPVEVPAADAGLPALRRTLRFASQEEQTLTFRAALASRIEQVADDAVRVGPLSLRLPAGSWRIRPAGEQQELLVEIRVGPGSAELVLEYGWREAGK